MAQERLIYIVDDEETISKLLEHWATKKWGYQARCFPNGEACLENLNVIPDLVLLDIMLPGIGGVDTLRAIKAQYPDLPVIMLSAQGKVEGVDADSLTISHGAIAELKWPAMTMPFNRPSPTAFADVKAGDTVHFEFKKKGDEYELLSVHRVGGAK